MDRLFSTHRIRKCFEAEPFWTMTTLDEGGLDHALRVLIPGVWEQLPALKRYRGRAVYTQKITCGGNIRFSFGGVSFRSRVWLDDTPLCSHYGAYTGFGAIAGHLPHGEHILRIEADNRFGPDSSLHIPNDYYSYGGINRPVMIECLQSAWIKSLRVIPEYSCGKWSARVSVSLQNLEEEEGTYSLSLSIGRRSVKIPVSLPTGQPVHLDQLMPCPDAAVWTPESPSLTYISAVLEREGQPIDDLIERFGFRQIRVHGTEIQFNGKPLRLKGFNRHEDFNDYGVSVPLEAMARDVQLLKDMGANCVRTCHYPNDPRFLDICDETGLLVWEESHARGLDDERMHHPLFMQQVMDCTREMVEQHINHPSIIIWGCLNECADNTAYGANCYRTVLSLLRTLDASRPVTAALLERPGGQVYGDVDAVSVNMYPQWYHPSSVHDAISRKIEEIHAENGGNKPLIISEIGAGAIYGFHDPFGEAKWSEERQASIIRRQLESVLTDERCAGVFIWQFADVRVDEEWFASRPRTFNNKGIVDEYRRPKMAYAAVREMFHKL